MSGQKELGWSSTLSPDGTPIENKQHLRDLGVHLSSDCTISIHIDNVVTSVSKMLGWVLRTFRSRSKVVMMTCWSSLLQSRLDYCCQLWSSCDQASITKLEGLAKQFSSHITGMEGLDYWERLKALQMYSQERRRERYLIIYIWKLAMGLVKGRLQKQNKKKQLEFSNWALDPPPPPIEKKKGCFKMILML